MKISSVYIVSVHAYPIYCILDMRIIKNSTSLHGVLFGQLKLFSLSNGPAKKERAKCNEHFGIILILLFSLLFSTLH